MTMKNTFVPISLLILAGLSSYFVFGQTVTVKAEPPTIVITNTEPATYKLEQLYRKADVVALVRVVSGDTENYDVAIYKVIVVTNFKGTAEGQILYYGPCIGEKLGSEYIVFLRSVKEPAVPKDAKNPAYGAVKYFEVFNQGYGSMETSYVCVFDGKDIKDHCDDGVRICTDYIILPKNIPGFPSMEDIVPMGFRWVRKSKFLSLLDEFADTGVLRLQ
jgi:hypothetical protein